MSNLLEETKDAIKNAGHEPKDIIFIGSENSGHACSWEQYQKLANFEYDSGFGSQKIAADLKIVFSDGSTMWRSEYDGSENWEYSIPFVMPKELKEIYSLGGDEIMWDDLATINGEEQ